MINGPTISNALTRANKSEIIGWGMPDYTAGISKAQNQTYTAEQNGWIYGYYTISNGKTLYFIIDGVNIGEPSAQPLYTMGIIPFLMFIGKGQTYNLTTTNTGVQMSFAPCKGMV